MLYMQARFGSLLFYIWAKQQNWLPTVLKRIMMARDSTPSWCFMREFGPEPLQFNWFRAAVWL